MRYKQTHITELSQSLQMVSQIKKDKPTITAFDTETTGLHIIHDKPFLFQFGWEGHTFSVEIDKQPILAKETIKMFLHQAKNSLLLAHNIKYDMHMLKNIGIELPNTNISDTMFYIRFAHDAIPTSQGGVPLGLKEYTTQYLYPGAKNHEKLLKKEQSAIAKDLNIKLKKRLNMLMKDLNSFVKDVTWDKSDFPLHLRKKYIQWLEEDVPIYLQNKIHTFVETEMIPYNILNRDNVIKYGHSDIIFVLELFKKLDPIITTRDNRIGLDIENRCIKPLFEMERVGFTAHREYLKESAKKMKKYIREKRKTLPCNIGQHAKIKEILSKEVGYNLKSVDNKVLEELKRKHDIPLINTIQELRSLEKWYSTYLLRFQKELKMDNKLYTTINQVGAVSGRVTSSFQQFPREGITTSDGEELFHPRKLIIPTKEATIFIDWSQIELRKQALYTVLLGKPDINLCRAFMPYQCDPETWQPTDVHGVMAMEIYPETHPEHPDWKKHRYEGKTTNFAKNYGASRRVIREMFPEKTEEEITKIDQAYYKAFPGVKHYHSYCYSRAAFSNTQNIWGVRYYNASGHKLINLLVQGSAAYFLKIKLCELYEYSKKHNLKSQLQMNIHDEFFWDAISEEAEHFFKFKEIMETFDDCIIPIIAEVSVSKTNWAEKKEVSTENELRLYLRD